MSDARPFFNQQPPQYTLQKERPRHRLICQMSINGFDNNEIAEALEMAPETIHNVLKQDWARDYMHNELADKADDMREMIMLEATKAFRREVDLAQTAKSESVKHQANTYLIDRYLGKPTQPIEEINKPESDMSDEELKVGLARLMKDKDAAPAGHRTGESSIPPIREPVLTSEPFPLENGFYE